jgi:hypothetical protein
LTGRAAVVDKATVVTAAFLLFARTATLSVPQVLISKSPEEVTALAINFPANESTRGLRGERRRRR